MRGCKLRGGICLEDVCACALTCGECPATLSTPDICIIQQHHTKSVHEQVL